MTLIDQRILIPAPVQTVWQVVADHRQLHLWRTDVSAVSMLSTAPNSPGARRRITPKGSQKDIIEEVTVWYEGLGYEYQLIEGSRFKSYVSRIRLQGTPDGTIVQWTVSYELGNFFKRLLRGRHYRKQITRLTTESLRNLLQYIKKMGVTLDQQYRDRTRIKEAPDVDARADYGTKRLAQAQEQAQATPVIIEEPPVRIDDTPSVPRVGPPSFLADAINDIAPDDTQPNKPIESQTPEDEAPSPAALADEDTTQDTKPKQPAGLDKAIQESQAPPAIDEADTSSTERPADLPPPTTKRDTGQISIWEVFGMERPKDTLTSIIDELRTDEETDAEPEAIKTITDKTVKPDTPTQQETPTLDEWLAKDEPPLPAGSSSTLRTIARQPKKTPRATRRRHLQRRLRLRPPRRR